MTKLNIPHDAFVFVADGRKALVLRNEGDEKFPNLRTEQVFVDADNPAAREQGTDSPGRAFASVGARRSSVEQTDWHVMEEQRFAKESAAALHRLVRDRKVKALVIAAPPKTLAELRRALHNEVKAVVVAEIDKDLTKLPVYEIEKHLKAA
ncbi:host cell attachment protein [Rhodoplanes elegans]|uniref:Host cell attachment protein n=1 Tax=Rhodoplanes elegans TaxID=29408 RepID=A0A327KE96_9BRAD|nr:host attachment family protein [Rhodoplanes elegans]MBK5959063.1 host cell attachment protein [Rhodoplanes elegans]RAI35973.1 host cell attachment protein [Rhodoplanes elegans]